MYNACTSLLKRRALRHSLLALFGVALLVVWWANDTGQANAQATAGVPPSTGIVVQPEERVIYPGVIYPGVRTGPDEL